MKSERIMVREKYLERIRPYYEMDVIKVLVGPRRAGKSMILMTIMNEINAEQDHIIYVNFEDMDYDNIKRASDLNRFVSKRIGEGRYYLFFDEIQHVSGFEKALASFKLKYDCSIFVTGSNSTLLSGELATLLVGRTKEFLIMPFSYSESRRYLEFLGIPEPENFFIDYIRMGGYPQRFQQPGETAVREFLSDLCKSVISKDITRRNNVGEKDRVMRIASFILSNSGSGFSARNVVEFLKREYGDKDCPSLQTVYNCLNRMEKAYLVKKVRKYNLSGKGIMNSVVKNYALDNGMTFVNTNSMDLRDTFFLETAIYDELISRGYEVYVGKTYRTEVDFVVVKDGKKCFIQVAYLLATKETIDREFGAFKPIRTGQPRYVMSLDRFDMSRDGITHLNVEDYLNGKVDIHLS